MAMTSFLDMHTSPMKTIIDLIEVLGMRLTHRMWVALVWYGKKTGKTIDEIWSGLRMQTALELPADRQDWDLITYERILTKIGSAPALGKTFTYDPLESNRGCLAPRLEDQLKVDASDEANFVVVGSMPEPPTVDYLRCLSVYEKARDAFLSARLGSYNWFMAFMAMAEAGVLLEHFKNAQESYGYSISKLRRAMLWEFSGDDDDNGDGDDQNLLSGLLNKNFGWEMEMCDGIEDELLFKPRSRATAGPCWNYKTMTWEPRIASPQADEDLPRPIVPYVSLCYNVVESVLDQREEYMQTSSMPFGKMVVDLSGAWMLKTLEFLREDVKEKHEEHRKSLENMQEEVMFDDYDLDHIKSLRSRLNKGV
ncbi:hypothetical protein SELMODRAFT_427890 [Selaginella moellendorffii]|uniref:Uncharacterized protein n=1 Tax=Selaginella moellendorffii TaxID=88036 RepID=D8T112_SELML|nr:hypothetical protein SELMODRAFT_427890 [Selaginella moellendorffii]